MPGRREQTPIDTDLCRRCQLSPPTLTVRTEPLCTACFTRYVATKAIKRLETFRVRHSDPGEERLLLLPLSFGPCSTALLYILSEHLKGQVARTGRTGFKLHVLHIDDASLPSTLSAAEARLELYKTRFPEHTYSIFPLSDITSDSSLPSPLITQTSQPNDPVQTLSTLLTSLPSPTSQSDTLAILRRRLITQHATTHTCAAILWSQSSTRLAASILAETAKGRGSSLASLLSPSTTNPTAIPSYLPLRDLLAREITSFTSLLSLTPLILLDDVKAPISTRDTSIDQLMRQYVDEVERDYPSVVANVVRTAAKLEEGQVEEWCELCAMPLVDAPERSRLCYGCVRTLEGVEG